MSEPFSAVNRERIRETSRSLQAYLTANLRQTRIAGKQAPQSGKAKQGINRESKLRILPRRWGVGSAG